ncbi:MAG: hypothetical protein ABI222_04600 [Opitutaceae bacterium]
MPAPSHTRQPWPMKWVVLAIILTISLYTFLTLHFRKNERAFRPYQDIRDRVNVHRLLDAGYQRIALEADLPADPLTFDSTVPTTAVLGGLPAGLRETLVELPQLPLEITSVSAAPVVNAMFAYPIAVKCSLPDNKQQLAGADLYVHGDQLVITPDFERLSGSLLARNRERLIRLTIPAGALKPGGYHVTLIGAHSSKSWTLQVH